MYRTIFLSRQILENIYLVWLVLRYGLRNSIFNGIIENFEFWLEGLIRGLSRIWTDHET